tara:strand:+ start:3634 stop:4485 length:852 start_codon:yes stop_codon:yes gene_type:complete
MNIDEQFQQLQMLNNRQQGEIEYLKYLLSEKEESIDHRFLGKLIYVRPDGVKVYASNSKQLVPNLIHWYYNRPLNQVHVQSLIDVSLDKKCLEGVIDILESEDEELCVVNGQHRVESIKEISKKDDKFNQVLIVNVHPVKSFDSDEAEKIFLATNNIQNVEMRDRPQKKLQNICNRMLERYPNGITRNPSGKANLHRMDIKELYNILQYNETFLDEHNSEDYLFDKLVELNTELSNMSYEDIFRSKRKTEKKDKLYAGAHKDNFYLGVQKSNQFAVTFQTKFK